MASAAFDQAYEKVVGYETSQGTSPVQHLSTDSGNVVNHLNVGTAYGLSGQTLQHVFFQDKTFADGTPNPYINQFDSSGHQTHITPENVNTVTPEIAKDITYHNYWVPIQGDALGEKMATPIFDSAFHQGPEKATAQLQANLASANLYDGKINGQMNPATVGAVTNPAINENVLYNWYHDVRVEGYAGSSSTYKDSFVNRVEQEYPKEPLTVDQQTQYHQLGTLHDFQNYLNTKLEPTDQIKADGNWGTDTRTAITQVGGTSATQTVSPVLQHDYQNWLADAHQPQSQPLPDTTADRFGPATSSGITPQEHVSFSNDKSAAGTTDRTGPAFTNPAPHQDITGHASLQDAHHTSMSSAYEGTGSNPTAHQGAAASSATTHVESGVATGVNSH